MPSSSNISSNIIIDNNKFTPINTQSETVLNNGEFALVGVSPFNSYFSTEQIFSILQLVSQSFDDFAIFIPDQISRFTLEALGYDENRIHHKIRKQENYLRNKVIKALEMLNQLPSSVNMKQENSIITLSSIKEDSKYLEMYNVCLELFANNAEFRHGCISTSSWILLSNDNRRGSIIDDRAKEIAAQYFLQELPVFLCAPEILKINSCTFIYNTIPDFLQEIYDDYTLASKSQGFTILS